MVPEKCPCGRGAAKASISTCRQVMVQRDMVRAYFGGASDLGLEATHGDICPMPSRSLPAHSRHHWPAVPLVHEATEPRFIHTSHIHHLIDCSAGLRRNLLHLLARCVFLMHYQMDLAAAQPSPKIWLCIVSQTPRRLLPVAAELNRDNPVRKCMKSVMCRGIMTQK